MVNFLLGVVKKVKAINIIAIVQTILSVILVIWAFHDLDENSYLQLWLNQNGLSLPFRMALMFVLIIAGASMAIALGEEPKSTIQMKQDPTEIEHELKKNPVIPIPKPEMRDRLGLGGEPESEN